MYTAHTRPYFNPAIGKFSSHYPNLTRYIRSCLHVYMYLSCVTLAHMRICLNTVPFSNSLLDSVICIPYFTPMYHNGTIPYLHTCALE